MKKLIYLSLATTFVLSATPALFAGDETEYSTRTLRARHATTTGSPAYADIEHNRLKDRYQTAFEANNEYDMVERMEERMLEEERETDLRRDSDFHDSSFDSDL